MDSPKKIKKIHFSISSFKKSKPLSSEIQIDDEQKDSLYSKFKRSSSYKIPKKFVPKLKPKKTTINPTVFILNEENSSNSSARNKEITETKNKNDNLSNEHNISNSSILDVNSDIEEENISDKKIDLLEKTSEKIISELNFKEKAKETKRINKNNSSSSLNEIKERKNLQEIKNNSNLMRSKECNDSVLFSLKNKFSLNNIKNDDGNNGNNYDFNLRKEKNFYKSSLLFDNDKNETKKRPFLIIDVLTQKIKRRHIVNI